MNLLSVVTPPYIYHGCSTWKTFLEKKFTGKENFVGVGHIVGNYRKGIKIVRNKSYIVCSTRRISERPDGLGSAAFGVFAGGLKLVARSRGRANMTRVLQTI